MTPPPLPSSGPATIGYLTKRFPRLSETFILDEILALQDAGLPLALVAMADPREPVVQPEVARVRGPVTYLHAGPGAVGRVRGAAAKLAAHAELLAENPGHYLACLVQALVSAHPLVALRHFTDAGHLAQVLRRAGATHLHAAFAHTPAAVAYQVHRLTGLPFSFAAHAKDLYLSNPAGLARRARAARFVLVCSRSAATELTRIAGPDARVELIYHGVDNVRFHPGPALENPQGGLRLLAVGRLVPKKGYPVLLEALAQVKDSGRSLTCTVIGAGPLREELTTQARALGLGDVVHFTGAQASAQVVEAYRNADVFVQASVVLRDGDRDGVPNSVLEAMASGLAVVASDVAGIPEVIDDEVTGMLVRSGDPRGLAAALCRLADDSGLRRRLGAAARSHVVTTLDRRSCGRAVARLFESETGVGAAGAPVPAPRLQAHR